MKIFLFLFVGELTAEASLPMDTWKSPYLSVMKGTKQGGAVWIYVNREMRSEELSASYVTVNKTVNW